MNYETAVHVYEAMGNGDNHLRLQVIRSAINYSKMRVEWNFLDVKERLEMSPRRTASHNAFIDSVNALCRSMSSDGQNTEWRGILGDNRQEIGDFACFLVAHLGILAR